jgi:uncharacterized protein (TIGR04255 family)
VCEIHFTLPQGAAWSPATPGALWREIAAEYPDIEPVIESGVELRVRPDGKLDQVITERKRYRFTDTKKARVVQFSENVISLNHLRPYPGWLQVRDELLRVWVKLTTVVPPSTVQRVGIRYINAIERQSADELASHWLNETPFLPRQPLHSLPPFSARVEARLVKFDRAIVSIGIAKRDAPFGYVLLDVDCIREHQMDADAESIHSAVADLHEDAWNIFLCAKTDALDALLNKKP